MEDFKFLCTIIFTLLLAIAFWANYEIAVQKKQGKIPKPSPIIKITFVVGVIALFLSFCTYLNQNPILSILTYTFAVLFLLLIIHMIIGHVGGYLDLLKYL